MCVWEGVMHVCDEATGVVSVHAIIPKEKTPKCHQTIEIRCELCCAAQFSALSTAMVGGHLTFHVRGRGGGGGRAVWCNDCYIIS